MSVEQARAKASKYVAEILDGKSVAEVLRAERDEPTVAAFFTDYLTRHAKVHKRTWDEDQVKFDKYLARTIGPKKLSRVTREDVASLHHKLTVAGHGTTANRVLALISTIFNKAIHWGELTGPNPCAGIRKNKETRRDRFLHRAELPAFFESVEIEPNSTSRDYVLLSLLTGARRANVMAMRWTEVSLDEAEWRIPRTKNGDPQTIPLGPEAVAILSSREKTAKSAFVFPGVGISGHLEEPKKGWQRILRRAAAIRLVRAIAERERWAAEQTASELRAAIADPVSTTNGYRVRATELGFEVDELSFGDLRLHDLRRTLGSWQAKTGASLSVIGKSLNHKNVSTTMIYARLDQDPVRESMERATAAMLKAANQ